MNNKIKAKVLTVLAAILLGMATTLVSDLYTTTTISPNNIVYSADNVLYHTPLVSVTQLKKRGFPFTSQAKIVKKYLYEYANKNLGPSPYKNAIISEFGASGITVQSPAVSSTGSNGFSTIFASWQFYIDILTWSVIWLLLGYLIRHVKQYRLVKRA